MPTPLSARDVEAALARGAREIVVSPLQPVTPLARDLARDLGIVIRREASRPGGGAPKVTVVGAGYVGSTTAMRIYTRSVADVVLVDVVEGLPQGLALDLCQSAPLLGLRRTIVGSNDYEPTCGSDVVVVTAGLARKPGMSRLDLLARNAEIVSSVVREAAARSPEAILIVVTNPLDEMTALAAHVSGFPKHRVMGMAGVLDSARFRAFIAERAGVHPDQVEAMTLGSHGDEMVPLPRHATVAGRPLTELFSEEEVRELVDRTRNAGAEIIAHLKTGSAYFAPSAAVAEMVQAILRDLRAVLPVSAWVQGEYGLRDLFVGVPAELGREGVRKILELDLNEEELAALRMAAQRIEEKVASMLRAV